jgi:hypothetical protein
MHVPVLHVDLVCTATVPAAVRSTAALPASTRRGTVQASSADAGAERWQRRRAAAAAISQPLHGCSWRGCHAAPGYEQPAAQPGSPLPKEYPAKGMPYIA